MQTNQQVRAECREEGWREQRRGGPITENPYEPGSMRWIWWRQGYNRAVERRNIPSGPAPSWRPGL